MVKLCHPPYLSVSELFLLNYVTDFDGLADDASMLKCKLIVIITDENILQFMF